MPPITLIVNQFAQRMLGMRSGKNEIINEAPIEETHESESSDEGSLSK